MGSAIADAPDACASTVTDCGCPAGQRTSSQWPFWLRAATIHRPSGDGTVGPHVPSIGAAEIVGVSPPPASLSADSVPPPARGSMRRAFVVRRVHAPPRGGGGAGGGGRGAHGAARLGTANR